MSKGDINIATLLCLLVKGDTPILYTCAIPGISHQPSVVIGYCPHEIHDSVNPQANSHRTFSSLLLGL